MRYAIAGLLVLAGLAALVLIEQQTREAVDTYGECVQWALDTGTPLGECR